MVAKSEEMMARLTAFAKSACWARLPMMRARATPPRPCYARQGQHKMSSIQSNFSPEELREHRELFESFDTDGSGEIDAEELQQLCGTLGNKLSLAEAEEMIADIDVDGNGLVDFNEFLSMMLDIRGSDTVKQQADNKRRLSFKKIVEKQAIARREKKERLLREKEIAAEARMRATEEKAREAAIRAYEQKQALQIQKMQQNDIAFFYNQEQREKIEAEKNAQIDRKAKELTQKAVEAERRQALLNEQMAKEAKSKGDVLIKKQMESQRKKEQLALQAEKERIAAEQRREIKRIANQRRAEIERKINPKDLQLFREQFESFDTDGSGSIDVEELGNIMRSLGEDLSRKQLSALIKEIDTDENGTIEWEEYLIAMSSKREEARRKGSGLLEFFSQKLEQVKQKKEKQLVAKEKSAELRAKKTEEERLLAAKRAQEMDIEERIAIKKKNEEQHRKAMLEKEKIEAQLAEQINSKAQSLTLKDQEAAVRIKEIEKEKMIAAKKKSLQTRNAILEKENKRLLLAKEKELDAIKKEEEREVQRRENQRRAEIERKFNPKDLRAFREQFDMCDTDGSGSIDVHELGEICRALGEDMTEKQVRALISEIDKNGNGLVEWEEYLEAMWIKRQDARKKGAGLLEFASKRAAMARKKKEDAAVEKEIQWQKKSEANDKLRREAVVKAEKMKEKEKELIKKRNDEIRRQKDARLDEIELEKQKLEIEKAKRVKEKEKLALQREKEIIKKSEAATKAKIKKSKIQGQKALLLKEQKIEEEEKRRIAREALKVKKRQENAERAEIERLFNPRDMKHFKAQFKLYDINNDGAIPVEKLGDIMSALGENLNDNELRKLIKEVDSDKSGAIEWNEYLLLMHKKREEAREKGMGLLEYASMRKKEAASKRDKAAKEQRVLASKKAELTLKEMEKANKRQAARKEKEKEDKIRANKQARKKADALQRQVELEKVKIEKEKAKKLGSKDVVAEQRKKIIEKEKKQAVKDKKKALLEKQRLAEEKRILKAKFEEQRRAIKEKMVKAKSAGKRNAVRILREKEKEIAKEEEEAFSALLTPKRPDVAQSRMARPSPRKGKNLV